MTPQPWRLPPDSEGLPFYQLLRAYREAAGLSQNRLAKLTHVDAAYISRMEMDPNDPRRQRSSNLKFSRDVALSLIAALGLPPGEADFFLWKAGHAPLVDWQARAIRAEDQLARIREALGEP